MFMQRCITKLTLEKGRKAKVSFLRVFTLMVAIYFNNIYKSQVIPTDDRCERESPSSDEVPSQKSLKNC